RLPANSFLKFPFLQAILPGNRSAKVPSPDRPLSNIPALGMLLDPFPAIAVSVLLPSRFYPINIVPVLLLLYCFPPPLYFLPFHLTESLLNYSPVPHFPAADPFHP